jgi:hypothetical protein
MNYNEYYDFIRQRMAEALYERHAEGFKPYIYQPPRDLNPEFKPTPKVPPPQKVHLHTGVTDDGQTVHVVRRLVGLTRSTPLVDDTGHMILFTSKPEAERAAYLCRKMVLLFDEKR